MYSPQTNIRLLSTPLENDGANTLTWNSITEQTNYFLSKTVFSIADTTYQRKGSYMRVDRNIEELYRCNYVMYKNSAYTDKWFYAFITDFEYVNDGVTYVYIEPDEILLGGLDNSWTTLVAKNDKDGVCIYATAYKPDYEYTVKLVIAETKYVSND